MLSAHVNSRYKILLKLKLNCLKAGTVTADEPNYAMTLAMKLARVDLSPEHLEKAKTVALDAAAQGQKISLRALIDLWEPIPQLHGFAQNLRLCVPLS